MDKVYNECEEVDDFDNMDDCEKWDVDMDDDEGRWYFI